MIHDAKLQDVSPFQMANDGNEMQSMMLIIQSMKEQMDGMERLFKRRFDEISMEINATSQQLGMTEDGLENRFSEILSSMSAISFSGTGMTAANTGVELQAVIADTEEAANKIIDAAERISTRINDVGQLRDETTKNAFLSALQNDVQDILMACSFQDLAGQRIRKTVESLQSIEDKINSTMDELGIEVKSDPLAGGVRDSTENHAHSQADIDALFS